MVRSADSLGEAQAWPQTLALSLASLILGPQPSNVGKAFPAAGLWGLGKRLSSCKGSINAHLLELATIPCFGT